VQISSLISFILLVINAPLAPAIARLYSEQQLVQLQYAITKSARLVFLLSLPVAAFIIIFGGWILMIFGADFTEGAKALSILATGQLVNITMGSVGIILVMTGHEKTLAISFGVAAIVNLALNFLLIPRWGINGAATATATSMIIWNVTLMIIIRRKLQLDPTALGKP